MSELKEPSTFGLEGGAAGACCAGLPAVLAPPPPPAAPFAGLTDCPGAIPAAGAPA
eukprot:CAMPEP_0202363636 /NCGR_PEP_ID=MMETSP1126-20121109/15347_1 /ASSEMBLY_ACC=CAM_ASM_000457 /TAXON_ID=3047 /ORGANISM="Dunaliella tertiolecta, Strain CCMP1320" /LENGTH=55 /DNA_ID=CAMNT_0048958083 /DNA_START=150 /DNA_END=314 /DNA_ORIENTATION=+